jgi:hypothetical protein
VTARFLGEIKTAALDPTKVGVLQNIAIDRGISSCDFEK